MTSDAHAPMPDEPRQGDFVVVNAREALFLYRRDEAAVIRYDGEHDARVVPLSKVRRRES